jgi:hypothetical protein
MASVTVVAARGRKANNMSSPWPDPLALIFFYTCYVMPLWSRGLDGLVWDLKCYIPSFLALGRNIFCRNTSRRSRNLISGSCNCGTWKARKITLKVSFQPYQGPKTKGA